MNWQPIETAPKDRDILVWCGEAWQPLIVRWNADDGEWATDSRIGLHPNHPPTYWHKITAPE